MPRDRQIRLLVPAAVLACAAPPALARQDDVRQARVRGENRREAFQRTAEILVALRVVPGALIADVGAGGGFFTVSLARAARRSSEVNHASSASTPCWQPRRPSRGPGRTLDGPQRLVDGLVGRECAGQIRLKADDVPDTADQLRSSIACAGFVSCIRLLDGLVAHEQAHPPAGLRAIAIRRRADSS